MRFFLSYICILLASVTLNLGAEDAGRASVGKLEVKVYFATDSEPSKAGDRFLEVSEEIRKDFQAQENLKFKHYRTLGADIQPIFRSYENWAQPLKPSDEVLLRFEIRQQATAGSVWLDLELWLARKKVLKTDSALKLSRPLYVLGPEWRGGRLIIAVELVP